MNLIILSKKQWVKEIQDTMQGKLIKVSEKQDDLKQAENWPKLKPMKISVKMPMKISVKISMKIEEEEGEDTEDTDVPEEAIVLEDTEASPNLKEVYTTVSESMVLEDTDEEDKILSHNKSCVKFQVLIKCTVW